LKKVVLHINSGTYGGPGRVVNTIYEIFDSNGYENVIVVPRGKSTKKIIRINKYGFYISRLLSKLYTYASTSKIIIEPEVYCSKKTSKLLKNTNSKIDYIFLYWYKNTITIEDVFLLISKTNAKLFVFLMDNAPMTGGCHYPDDCEKYLNGCGNCPSILWGIVKKDITYKNVKNEKLLLEKCNATIICPTTLSLIEAGNCLKLKSLKKQLAMIPLSEDYSIELSKCEARKLLSIPLKGKVVFFGAQSMKNKRKGMLLLIKALKIVFNKLNVDERNNVCFAIAGKSLLKEINGIGFNFISLGYLNHMNLIYAYKSADFFISPSTVDMGPMMVSESIKSGTPVISFNIGSSKDLVIDGITGFTSEVNDFESLAEKILYMIKLPHEENERMSKNCKNIGNEILTYNSFFTKIKQLL
jgi:glycosyltransferase involved in cell wall biosynthesis